MIAKDYVPHDPENPDCQCEDCKIQRLMTGRPVSPARPKRTLAELYKTARQKGIVKAISSYK